MIHLVLLSGGSGTRLWPLSNNARSKQFLKVLRDDAGNHISMVQRVFGQIANVRERSGAQIDVTIATSANQESSIRAQLDGGYELVAEPVRRDTAPAIMLACAHLEMVQGAAADDEVIVMPIDTFADQAYYDRITQIAQAVQECAAELVLLGVAPTYPSAKYGYIVPEGEGEGESENESEGEGAPSRHPEALQGEGASTRHPERSEGSPALQGEGASTRHPERSEGSPALQPTPVSRFVEKPTEPEAASLIAQGALWNCGVFGFRLGYLRDLTKRYLDCATYDQMLARYGELPKISFDYEVVERAESVAVVPHAGTWKDLGTWNTLAEEMADWASGRVVADQVENVHIVNETALPMVVTGLKDAVVVATHDGILVADKAQSSQMKPLVERIAETRPMYEKRRWGEYRVLDSRAYGQGKSSLVKELIVAPGAQLSYQRHAHRSEAWTITSGTGEVVLDGKVTPVVAGTAITIHPMQMHAARAFDELHIVEVQLGDPLAEEDIERFGDYWSRKEVDG